MKKSQLKIGAVLSYAQMAINVLIGLVYTPVMLKLLGQSEHGLYNTVSSIISMLSVLSLGFNAAYIRYFAKYKKDGDKEAVWKLNGLFITIFSIIGLIALVCGTIISFSLGFVYGNEFTANELDTAKILMLLLTLNLSLSFPFSVFSNIISANERFVFLKLLGMISTIISPLVTLPVLLAGYGSIGMVAVTVFINLLVDAIYFIYVIFVLKNKFVFKSLKKGIFKELFAYTGFIAINIIIDQINWKIDKIVLGAVRGTVAVSVYSIGYTLYQYYMMFSTSISGLFTPRIHKIANDTLNNTTEQNRQFTEIFIKVGRIQFLILGLVGSGLVFFGYEFISVFWAGAGYEDSYAVMLLLVLPATIALMQNLGVEIQRAQNKHKFRSVIYAGMAVWNLVSSIFLAMLYGPIGSAIGTAVSLVLANGLIMNIYYYKKCNINIIAFWKNILKVSLGLIVPIAFGIGIRIWFDLTNIWLFVLGVVLYTIVYCISMWFIGMNKYEKSLVLRPIKKILRKSE